MSTKIATIIGATGLVGSHLLQQLQKDDYFTTIRVLVRRPFPHTNFKTEVKLVAFDDTESFKMGIDGSHTAFCAVGTTLKKMEGNNEEYRKIDFDIAMNAVRYCKETGCTNFSLVSSVGANSNSNNFYLKLKGETEEAVKRASLRSVSIFRPSVLLGDRREKRAGEKFAQITMQAFSFALLGGLSKYKPIHASDVASAMISAAKREKEGVTVYEFKDMKA